MSLGWECPRCHAVWGPFVARCGNCMGTIIVTFGASSPCQHEYDYGSTAPSCRKCGAPAPPNPPSRITVAMEAPTDAD